MSDVLDTLYFLTIALYLHNTNRIKGVSLRRFSYNHSSFGFNDKNSVNYLDIDKTKKEFVSSSSDSSDTFNEFDTKTKKSVKKLKYKKFIQLNERFLKHGKETSPIMESIYTALKKKCEYH